MAIRMSGGVVKRTDGFYARKTIPADIRKHFPAKKRKGAQFQTDFFKKIDASTLRQAEVQAKQIHAEWDRIIELARAGEWPQPNQREISLLAGEFWKWARASSKEPQYLLGSFVGTSGEVRMRATLAQFLAAKGLPYRAGGPTSETIFERAYSMSDLKHRNDAAERLGKTLDGIEAEWTSIAAAMKGKTAPLRTRPYTWETLFADWARDTHKSDRDKTVYSWKKIIAKLIKHVGHEDADRITHEDRIGWKDALVKAGELSSVTIGNHLTIAQTLLNWAFNNKQISTRPETVKYTVRKKQGTNKIGYTDEEARTILLAARKQKEPHKRWIPWLAAFSGARVDELAGAYAADVVEIGGVPCLHIRPDHRGTTVKNEGSVRVVPIHSAVIAEGFLKYVATLAKNSPLFPEVKPDRFGKRGGNAQKKIGRWIRDELEITNPRISPNHSWRHRFESEARVPVEGKNKRIDEEDRDAITGHKTAKDSRDYGEYYVSQVLAPAIERIPSPV